MKQIFTGVLLLSFANSGWTADADSTEQLSGDAVYKERTANIEVEGAFWDIGAPKTLYCRFPIRQWTRDKVATQLDIAADELDGTALVNVGKEKTILQQGKFTHELHTLTASSSGVHAVDVNFFSVNDFQYDDEGHALRSIWPGQLRRLAM
jgi:hypothetical protein